MLNPKKSLLTRMLSLFLTVFVIAITIVTTLNNVIARKNLQDRLFQNEVPATIDNILAEFDKQLMHAAIGLGVIAEDPLFIEWIRNGEPEGQLPLLIERLRLTTDRFKTKGSNYVSWNTKNYYNFADGKYSPRTVTDADTWFPAFKKSGKEMNINVYTGHELYGTVAFMNYRIDDNDTFLGLVSVVLDLNDFAERVISMTIGEKGNTYLVDQEGNIELHQDKDIIGTNINDLIPAKYHDKLKGLFSKDDFSLTYKRKGQGTLYLNSRYIPEVGWYLVTEASKKELFGKMNGALATSVIVTLILIALGVWLTYYILRSMVNDLKKGVALADAVSEGNLDVSMEITRDDEIGQLGNAMTRMITSLQEKGAMLESIASGDLTVDVPLSSDKDSLGHSLEKMKASLIHLLSQVQQAAEEVSTSTQEIASATQSLAAGATEQASSVEEISASVQHIRSQVEISSEKAGEASSIADSAVTEAGTGHVYMEELKVAMEKITVSADHIKGIVKMIDDIAFQTNLLALNAAVEAARAGQAGKGFAVVADEVRNLANRSARAVVDASKMVEEVIESIHNSSGSMEKTASKLDVIVEQVNKLTENLSTIDEMSKDNVSGTKQISEALGQIEDVTQNTAAVAEEGAAASTELEHQSKLLEELTHSFKLEGTQQKKIAPQQPVAHPTTHSQKSNLHLPGPNQGLRENEYGGY